MAARLDALPPRQVSAYVAETIRSRAAADDMRALLAKVGMKNIPPYDPVGAAAKVAEARAKITDDMLESAYAQCAGMTGRDIADVRAEFEARRAEFGDR
ncbi:MAG TPA: hypothetical protein VGF17_31135 [Phytomonospora sp.]